MTLEIQVLAWDRHKNVVELSLLMESNTLDNWISNGLLMGSNTLDNWISNGITDIRKH